MFRTVDGFEDVLYRVSGGDSGCVHSGAVDHYATSFVGNARTGVNSNFSMNNQNVMSLWQKIYQDMTVAKVLI